MRKIKFLPVLCALLFMLANSCSNDKNDYVWKTREVTASAYNSVRSQTANHPSLAAWGDTLRPGMKVIAVSRDLIPLGLDYNAQVKIEGLDGIYLVKDKMHYRWANRIDIYMGKDIAKAKNWGRKKLKIEFRVKKDKAQNTKK
ncbi:MAG: 3D domain-containing protein [Pricia sp.]|nr:3D domain-containing protein [Pricia sp.]